MNALFAAGDDTVLRVGRPTADPSSAIWLAEHLGAAGIRMPRYVRADPIVVGELAVFAIAREPTDATVDWFAVGRMIADLHRLDAGPVSAGYPTPTFPWWNFDRMVADVADLIDDEARRGLDAATARHQPLRGQVTTLVLCHGDVHPGNVLQTPDGPMIIDWDLMCLAPIAWDHAPLMTWTSRWGGEPGIYEAFADGYRHSLRGDPMGEALAELRLVASTLMRLRAGRTDPEQAAEAQRRLRFWRGDPDAPAWRAA
jgi:Ser/Thr protein kinase RdoA (MazF antagonist)